MSSRTPSAAAGEAAASKRATPGTAAQQAPSSGPRFITDFSFLRKKKQTAVGKSKTPVYKPRPGQKAGKSTRHVSRGSLASDDLAGALRHNTISLTFGDRAENHVGMQILGEGADEGFTRADLEAAARKWEALGCKTELVPLHTHVEGADEAYVLIARRGLQALLRSGEGADESKASVPDATGAGAGAGVGAGAGAGAKASGAAEARALSPGDLFREQFALDVDKHAWMKGRVVNKRARYNLCFGPERQAPDYEAKKGRIVAFRDVPILQRVRKALPEFVGPKGRDLMCELNLYYDLAQCGIGFHGDTERKLVVCLRLGATIPLHYQWFLRSTPVGDRVKLELNHGDVYVMSAKAVGADWKHSSMLTLRHAAGAAKFLKISKPVAESAAALYAARSRKHASGERSVNTRPSKKAKGN